MSPVPYVETFRRASPINIEVVVTVGREVVVGVIVVVERVADKVLFVNFHIMMSDFELTYNFRLKKGNFGGWSAVRDSFPDARSLPYSHFTLKDSLQFEI
jgi:hypothetical protein